MGCKKIAFFNNKGGVGKTTLLFNLGCALEKLEKRILFVDLDPQCNLTANICGTDEIESIWDKKQSIFYCIKPLITGTGDIDTNSTHKTYKKEEKNIWLMPGDIFLSDFEETLSNAWTQALAGREIGFRITSSLFRLIDKIASANNIDYVFIDVGPNLGSLNRSVMLSCDYYLIPLVPDLFSLRGLQNIGTVFKRWIAEWGDAVERFRKQKEGSLDFPLQKGEPVFAGYINQQFNIYRKKATKAWGHWSDKVDPSVKQYVIDKLKSIKPELVKDLNDGSYKLGDFKSYHSLVPKSQEKKKAIFDLGRSDGIIGQHIENARMCGENFKELAEKLDRNLN